MKCHKTLREIKQDASRHLLDLDVDLDLLRPPERERRLLPRELLRLRLAPL